MKILVTICARGGSKGVKNKNIRELAGKPLIAYTIEVAKKWGKADKIICSTDSLEIASIAKEYGAEVPFMRPSELASDTAGKLPVIRHALIESERIYNQKFDLVVDLSVTSPIRTADDLNNALEIFIDKKPDVITSVVEASRNPYFNMVELDEQGFAYLCKETKETALSRQAAPKVYSENASMFFHTRDFVLDETRETNLSSDRVAVYVMDELSDTDIDNELDFKFIEFLISRGEFSFD